MPIEPAEFSGPLMRALPTDRMRKFCWLMACGEWSGARAAREAGYSDSGIAAKVRAHELMHDPRILDAIEEAARSVLRGLAPIAILKARAVLENPRHPAHVRMIETILDRTGFGGKTEHKVVVEHVDQGRFLQIAARLALELGVEGAKLVGGNVVEGKVVGDGGGGSGAELSHVKHEDEEKATGGGDGDGGSNWP